MRRPRAFVPAAPAALEPRVVPSRPAVVPAAARVVVIVQPPPSRPPASPDLDLAGTIDGVQVQARVGGPLRVTGQGMVAPLGMTTIAGTLRPVGGAAGLLVGRLTLTGGAGSLVLQVRGSIGTRPPGVADGSFELEYLVVAGTGAYRDATGGGRFAELLASLGGRPTRPRGPVHESFRLTFEPSRPVEVFLTGTMTGTVSQSGTSNPAGMQTDFHGQGMVAPLGTVDVTGFLTTVGAGDSPPVSGVLVLSSDRGTLTLRIGGVAEDPDSFLSFTIEGGTGADAGLTGTAVGDFRMGGPAGAGHFTLSLSPPLAL